MDNSCVFLPRKASVSLGAEVVWKSPLCFEVLSKAGFSVGGVRDLEKVLIENFALELCDYGNLMVMADYYGSSGMSTAGGSGRAACHHGFQIKGIGRTGLEPSGNADWFHTNGFLTVEEAFREVYFSERFRIDAPYSSAVCLAIIALSGKFEFPDGSFRRRALLVREFVPRLAHFERAFGYRNRIGLMPSKFQLRDIQRIRVWNKVAPVAADGGLERLAARIGRQICFLHVFHLHLGGAYSSNFCVHGQLIDFGSARRVPSWLRTCFAPGAGAFGCELEDAARALTSVAESLNYYCEGGVSLERTLSRMTSAYEDFVPVAYQQLAKSVTGKELVPRDDLARIFAEAFKEAQHASSASEARAVEDAFNREHLGVSLDWGRLGESREELQREFSGLDYGEAFDLKEPPGLHRILICSERST